MTLAKRIVAWREARGLTQAELAAKLDVSLSAVWQWEEEYVPKKKPGRKDPKVVEPSFQTIVKLADVFGVDLPKFFGSLPKKTKRAA